MTYGELSRLMSVREFAEWQILARLEAGERARTDLDRDAAAGAAAALAAVRRGR